MSPHTLPAVGLVKSASPQALTGSDKAWQADPGGTTVLLLDLWLEQGQDGTARGAVAPRQVPERGIVRGDLAPVPTGAAPIGSPVAPDTEPAAVGEAGPEGRAGEQATAGSSPAARGADAGAAPAAGQRLGPLVAVLLAATSVAWSSRRTAGGRHGEEGSAAG
jgi:hypothetical protein